MMKDWKYDSLRNIVTAIDNGGCRVDIVTRIYGTDIDEVQQNGMLVATLPMLYQLYLAVLKHTSIEMHDEIVVALDQVIKQIENGEKGDGTE